MKYTVRCSKPRMVTKLTDSLAQVESLKEGHWNDGVPQMFAQDGRLATAFLEDSRRSRDAVQRLDHTDRGRMEYVREHGDVGGTEFYAADGKFALVVTGPNE